MNKLFFIVMPFLIIACGSSKKIVSSPKKKIPTATNKGVVYKKTVPVSIPMAVSTTPVVMAVDKDSVKIKTEVLEATSRVRVTTEMVNNYITQFKEIAKHNMKEHGVPASITLAQAILESGAGTGALCLKANNHFGIKCHKEWQGESVSHDDDAPKECFRKYDDPSQSFTDHSLFLTSRPWYAPLFKLQKNDYKGWSYGLKKSGYATDPKYPNKLIGIIEKYHLQQIDEEVLGISSGNDLAENANADIILAQSEAVAQGVMHVVAAGDTLYSISKKYNISIDFLKVKNNLLDNSLSIGQTLIIK
jgi:flagellum-specific peptidoglycan hydrolase FlgJ